MSVLIADDDHDIVELMAEMLTCQGINVLGKAYDGKQAVDLCSTVQPDILLLDLKMPQYDGVYTLEELEKRKISPKIIVITAEQNPNLIKRIREFNPEAIIPKPIDCKQVIKLIIGSKD